MTVQRLAFSSPGLSAGAAEAQRLASWWEEYRDSIGGVEVTVDLALPFATSVEYLGLGAIGLGRSSGTIVRLTRPRNAAARDGDDRFFLVINQGASPTEATTSRRSATILPNSAVLIDYAESGDHVCPGCKLLALMLPRRLLRAALPQAEDIVGTVIPAQNDALRLLIDHGEGLLNDHGLSDPAVLSHAGKSLMDLAVLAFGTDRDNAEIARLRGLRAARLAAVLRVLRAEYADPDISPGAVAARVGISTRYLHVLLHETGSSFAERVLELRLAKAFTALTSPRAGTPKISDAAYEAGFNDLSQFNRSFRRKYGLTPTGARGGEIPAGP